MANPFDELGDIDFTSPAEAEAELDELKHMVQHHADQRAEAERERDEAHAENGRLRGHLEWVAGLTTIDTSQLGRRPEIGDLLRIHHRDGTRLILHVVSATTDQEDSSDGR